MTFPPLFLAYPGALLRSDRVLRNMTTGRWGLVHGFEY